MQIKKIGVVSPGDMGQAIATRLKESGLAVYTALDGRSARTMALAEAAGLADCGSIDELAHTCDMILSVLNPGAAVDKARQVAAAMKATGRKPLFVDCNAIAPQTAREIDAVIRSAGGSFVDAGILGSPPRGDVRTRIFLSGPNAFLLEQVLHPNLVWRVLSERIGDASAIKMCYGALTKGAVALGMELLIAARRLGVEDALETELNESLAGVYRWLDGRFPSTPPKAYRWVPEMNEIAKTFEAAGLTPRILLGAADMFEFVADTPLGRESPEQARAHGRGGHDVIRQLADWAPVPPRPQMR